MIPNKGDHDLWKRLRPEAETWLEHNDDVIGGSKISENEWAAACVEAEFRLESTLQDDESFIEEALWLLERNRALVLRRQENQKGDRVASPDPRFAAFAEVLARDASRNRGVKEWRNTYLTGRLLTEDEIHAFFERAQRESPPLSRVTVWASGADGPDYNGDGITVHVRGRLHMIESGNLLTYVDDADKRHETEVHGEALAALVGLTEDLESKYGWDQAYAARFVLTGMPPSPWSQHGTPAFGRWSYVHLTIDPRTPGRQVLRLYGQLRRLSRDGCRRRIDEKTANLVRFLCRQEELSWPQLRDAWNAENPDNPTVHYVDYKQFARDATRAWERVAGEKLRPGAESLRAGR